MYTKITIIYPKNYKNEIHYVTLYIYSRYILACKRLTALELVGWLCFTSHRQRGHLETPPPIYKGLAKDVKLDKYTVPTVK